MARVCAGFNMHSHMLRQHVGNPATHHHDTLLHDLGKAMPRWRFEQIAKRADADRRVRTLPCWSQFIAHQRRSSWPAMIKRTGEGRKPASAPAARPGSPR
jgi:hypothetical protein